jgi:hypothetical protein
MTSAVNGFYGGALQFSICGQKSAFGPKRPSGAAKTRCFAGLFSGFVLAAIGPKRKFARISRACTCRCECVHDVQHTHAMHIDPLILIKENPLRDSVNGTVGHKDGPAMKYGEISVEENTN